MLFQPADPSKAKRLAAETGATAISSVREMAKASSSIITMLPNTPNVEAVYLGNINYPRNGAKADPRPLAKAAAAERGTEVGRGLVDLVQPGTLLVDSSTIDPLTSRRINAMATSKVNKHSQDYTTYEQEVGRSAGPWVDGMLMLIAYERTSSVS